MRFSVDEVLPLCLFDYQKDDSDLRSLNLRLMQFQGQTGTRKICMVTETKVRVRLASAMVDVPIGYHAVD